MHSITTFKTIFAGITNVSLEEEHYDLGDGITISQTATDLISLNMLAYGDKSHSGYHSGPWKDVLGGAEYAIRSQIVIPDSISEKIDDKFEIIRSILFLLKIKVDPGARVVVYSPTSLSDMGQVCQKGIQIFPGDLSARKFPAEMNNSLVTRTTIEWISMNWKSVFKLIQQSAAFDLAIATIDSGQYNKNTALTLVSVWGSLEALFLSSTSELRFRIASMISSYLVSRGPERYQLYKKILKLYDKRSAAAHGYPKHSAEDLMESFNLLLNVLLKIIDNKELPTKELLEQNLFS